MGDLDGYKRQTRLRAGLGTLLFHLITKGKVPAFLGSSFAFLGGYWALAPNGEAALLPYACVGVACAGLLYILLAILFKTFGPQKVMRFFPPIVTGPIIISIGPVSYTHLGSGDAYAGKGARGKERERGQRQRFGPGFSAGTGGRGYRVMASMSAAPYSTVSYTHLPAPRRRCPPARQPNPRLWPCRC